MRSRSERSAEEPEDEVGGAADAEEPPQHGLARTRPARPCAASQRRTDARATAPDSAA